VFVELFNNPRIDRPFYSHRQFLSALGHDGWTEDDLNLIRGQLEDSSMDALLLSLTDAARHPLGPIENPRGLVTVTPRKETEDVQAVTSLLMARGLSKLKTGSPADFVYCLEAALAISRNARTQQPGVIFREGLISERVTLEGLNLYLERFQGSPELLHAILWHLEHHDKTCPTGVDVFLTERMIARNTLNEVSQWAPRQLAMQFRQLDPKGETSIHERKGQLEADLFSFALTVPWEKERARRLFGIGNQPGAINRRANLPYYRNQWLGMYLDNESQLISNRQQSCCDGASGINRLPTRYRQTCGKARRLGAEVSGFRADRPVRWPAVALSNFSGGENQIRC
jgi:hypothetical protein